MNASHEDKLSASRGDKLLQDELFYERKLNLNLNLNPSSCYEEKHNPHPGYGENLNEAMLVKSEKGKKKKKRVTTKKIML